MSSFDSVLIFVIITVTLDVFIITLQFSSLAPFSRVVRVHAEESNPLTPPLCLHFVFARRRPTIFVIHNRFIFPAQVQAPCLQDAQPRREAVEEHQFSDEPEEVSRPRARQQC